MTKRVQILRHDPASAAIFLGLEGEVSVELSNFFLRVHDGATKGGHIIPNTTYIDQNYQAKSSALDAINSLTTTGMLVRASESSYFTRSLAIGSAHPFLGITNPAGISGDPTISWTGPEEGSASDEFSLNGDFDANHPGKLIPVGGIILWSGSIANIPTGFVLCDGTNNTPDLRNKFVLGAHSDDGGVAQTNITGSLTWNGGSKDISATATLGGNHNHGGATTSVGLSAGQGAPHRHYLVYNATNTTTNYSTSQSIKRGWPFANEDSAYQLQTDANTPNSNPSGYPIEGSGLGHYHGIADSGTHTHVVDGTNANLPPYRVLAYIMRVS